MAAPDTTAIDKAIDDIVYLDTSVNGKKPGVTALRAAYKAVTKWAREKIVDASTWRKTTDASGSVDQTDTAFRTGRTIVGREQDNGSGASFQTIGFTADWASVPNINGIRLNYWVRIAPVTGASAVRYMKVAQFLQYDSAASAELLSLSAAVGGWGATNREVISLTCGNRGRFGYQSSIIGAPTSCGFAAYEQPDKTVYLYLRMPNDFYVSDVSILLAHQVTVFAEWKEEAPTGTLVYDSTDRVNYPPTMSVDPSTLAVRGMLRTGTGNRAFKVTSPKPGSGLTLNTSQYLEIQLEDGTIWKVPTFN